jgi:hypothetical protein
LSCLDLLGDGHQKLAGQLTENSIPRLLSFQFLFDLHEHFKPLHDLFLGERAYWELLSVIAVGDDSVLDFALIVI